MSQLTAFLGKRPSWSEQLRAAGRRVTKQRLAVVTAVETHPHSTAEAILEAARQELPALSAQAVYVVLGDLTDMGMLRRFEPPQSPALYETRVKDNHHHAVCTHCGRIEDVDCAVGHAPCLEPHWNDSQKPMTIQIADVLYQGICQDCLAAEAAEHEGPLTRRPAVPDLQTSPPPTHHQPRKENRV